MRGPVTYSVEVTGQPFGPIERWVNNLEIKFLEDVKYSLLVNRIGGFNLWYRDLVLFFAGFVSKLQSSQEVNIRIADSFPENLDYGNFVETLINDVIEFLIKRDYVPYKGYVFESCIEEDETVTIKRLSVNGFNPHNTKNIETGAILEFCESDKENEVINEIFFLISSLRVGQNFVISIGQNHENQKNEWAMKDRMYRFIEEARTKLFNENFRPYCGFRYKYERVDQFSIKIHRLSLDGQEQPVEEF